MPKFLLDENIHKPYAIIAHCERAGVRVEFVTGLDLRTADDEDIFPFAVENDWVIVTNNIGDFAKLFSDWVDAGNECPGMIFVQEAVITNIGRVGDTIIAFAQSNEPNRIKFVS